jgi:hypothetical protein
MMTMNGYRVTMTNNTGQMINNVMFTHTNTFINLTLIEPVGLNYPVCWLVIPGKNFQ